MNQYGIAIALRKVKVKITMINEIDRLNTQQDQDESTDPEKAVREKLNRIANKASKQAVKRQQRYDGKHGIFTK